MSFRFGSAAIALSIAGALLSPLSAQAAPVAEPDLDRMGSYPAARYASEAATLPGELLVALGRDVGISGAEYLAEAEAAVQAVAVVESLEAAGVEVLGSRLDGTELVVNVETDADAELVEETGATVEIGEPEPFVLERPARRAVDVWNGQGYYWTDDPNDQSGYICSTGFQGFLTATGAPQLVTAGHCLEGAENMEFTLDATVNVRAGLDGIADFIPMGDPLVATRRWGSSAPGYDVARIAVTAPGVTPQPGVLTWGYGGGAPGATPRISITGQTAPIQGATLCRSGVRTGWACGPITQVDFDQDNFVDENEDPIPGLRVRSVTALVCSLPGDSGGPAIVGTNAIGILSWTQADPDVGCRPGDQSGFFQMISPGGFESVASAYGSAWEPEVIPPAPAISTAAAAANPTAITGTVPSAGRAAANSVALFLDGSSTAWGTDTTVTDGTWSIDVSGVPNGLHTYTVVTRYGSWSSSTSVAGYFSKNVTVSRLTGTDRWGTSIDIAQEFTAPVPVLYLTTGLNYPDALSSGPAAAHLGGPVMLVQPVGITSDVLAQITALDPQRVIVLGAENSVSASAFAQIDDAVFAASGVRAERLTGADRFGTSRAIARDAFLVNDTDPGGATVAYISNGLNFPDALSAGGAAATVDAPVILVNGLASSVPNETIALLDDLGVTEIVVTGAANSVSDAIFVQLSSRYASVVRQTGLDRFGTSAVVNAARFSPTETRALLATGLNYPDALAGSALAGEWGAPLYITEQACIRDAIFAELVRLRVTQISLLGNTPSLSADVAALRRC